MVRELVSIFGQQSPGFAVVFVFVAVLMDGGDRAEGYGFLDGRSQKNGGRDQVPDLLGDDVAGEQVKVIDGVGLGDQIVAAELAEISGAVAGRAGFDLHPHQAAEVLDTDVIFEAFSPGFKYVEAAQGGRRHE